MPRIHEIVISKLPIPLRKPFVISLERFTHAENLVVAIHTDDGKIGWGECSPFPSINGETMESAYVVAQRLSKALLVHGELELHGCKALVDSCIFGNFSVKSAFDIALHDLAAQLRGIPLYEYWGAPQWRVLRTDYTVSLGEVEQMVKDAVDIKVRGFEQIKVKLGRNPDVDIQRIKEIRAAIGTDIPLRLDANQGWDLSGAIKVLRALEDDHVLFCEAPLPRHCFMDLPELRRQVPIPIMADECCFDHHDADRLLAAGGCDYLNLKLGKSGGLLEGRKILRVAERYGTKVQVGGFLESRLAFTAAAHLALSSPAVEWVDFDSPMMMKEDPVEGGIRYGKGGLVHLPEGIGLGASILSS